MTATDGGMASDGGSYVGALGRAPARRMVNAPHNELITIYIRVWATMPTRPWALAIISPWACPWEYRSNRYPAPPKGPRAGRNAVSYSILCTRTRGPSGRGD